MGVLGFRRLGFYFFLVRLTIRVLRFRVLGFRFTTWLTTRVSEFRLWGRAI